MAPTMLGMQETAPPATWTITDTDLWLLAVVLTMWLLLILGSGFMVLKASKSPPPLALVLVLSMVTLVCIAAFVVTKDQVILQLASVGLGALAAAVATTWGSISKHYDEEIMQLRKKVEKVEDSLPDAHDDHEDGL
jgi:hypothetical protein